MGVDAEGALECTPVTQGESANAPINAPHGLMNRSDRPARSSEILLPRLVKVPAHLLLPWPRRK